MAVVMGVVAWQSGMARAGSFQVTNTLDSGDGSLRAAITSANLTAGPHTIEVTATGTIEVLGSLPTLMKTVTITGPGADKLTIHQQVLTVTVITISGAAVTLSGVTVSGGMASGISVDSTGSLVLRDSVITGNTSPMTGAAIYANGPLTIERSTITGNSGTGVERSAVYAGADTTVIDSTIADNTGTAIVFAPSVARTLTIDRSTVSGNSGTGIGGLELRVGAATISNSTFSGNTSGDFWTSNDGVTLKLTNVTSMGSGTPALLFDHPTGTTVSLLNTILAGTGPRCSAASHPTSRGHNLASDMSCNLSDATDRMGTDPLLGPLQANGGATRTHALLATSPAINAGGGVALAAKDQRGLPRVQFAAADIGAVEVAEPVIAMQPVPQQVAVGKQLTLSVMAQDPDGTTPLRFQWRKDGAPITGATSDTFTRSAAQTDDTGSYDVLLTNDGGSIASTPVMVTVAEVTGSGGCSSTRTSGGPSGVLAALALALALALLGYRRRRRANQRHAG
jgi:MYXO-CTERM domain-containing protein